MTVSETRRHRKAAVASLRAMALTGREREVLQRLADGERCVDIARADGLSLRTVQSHVRNACGKLGAHTQLQAVMAALRAGVVRL